MPGKATFGRSSQVASRAAVLVAIYDWADVSHILFQVRSL